MFVDATNPAFPRAIPHGTVIIDLLHRVVFFGVSPGCLRAVSPGSHRGHIQGVSESILRASSRVFEHELEPKLGTNSNLNWNAYLERKLDLGLKLEIELGLELSNSNSNSDSNAATRTRTQELELEPELYFGLQRALELGLELQAYLSFRCTSSQV